MVADLRTSPTNVQLTLTACLLGLAIGPLGWRGALAVVLALSVAMLVAVLVVVRESHTAARRAQLYEQKAVAGSPLRDLTRRAFVGQLIAFSFSFAMMMAYISASPFIYQNMMGLSSAQYGAAFGINALGLLLSSGLARGSPHATNRTGLPASGSPSSSAPAPPC